MLCTTGSSVLSGDHSPDIRGIGTEKGHFVVILLFWIIASFFSTDHCVKEMNVYSQPMQCISCSLLSAPPTFLILTTFCHWNAWGGEGWWGRVRGKELKEKVNEREVEIERERRREKVPPPTQRYHFYTVLWPLYLWLPWIWRGLEGFGEVGFEWERIEGTHFVIKYCFVTVKPWHPSLPYLKYI